MRDDGGLSECIGGGGKCSDSEPIRYPGELFLVLIRKRKIKLMVWGLTKLELS